MAADLDYITQVPRPGLLDEWNLHDQIGSRLADKVLITSGDFAYRRPDGVAVVPLALLGP